ncbi:methionyl-tRNA formyltransferase [Savagea sp. SN6]|uniref:Methionyl-tRNA formyltransferase n=1 Tax=Savagea serpentis TaxID=2785297 RepID=A0A8J7KKF4_9BACL|nr:methionyl-tRNA formyltransferase [Savagea serpentis]MBF4499894.1 methionyl-tRNA formyltransferase [Savagea serpentis]
MTKIIFMGTPPFSVPILTMLHEEGYDIVGVVTQPDRPVGRKRVMTPTPVKEEALRLGLPVYQPDRLSKSEELEQLINLQPDLIVTAAYGQIVPNELLDVPRLRSVNVHASLLPKYRGGAPIHQAIIDGEKETGVTIMYMEEKLDAGNMIAKRAIPITDEDDTGTMFDKLSLVGRDLLKETMPAIIAGTNDSIPQDESLVTFASNITREQERIDWNKSARQIFNHVRGLHPWPVAYTTFDGENVKIYRTSIVDETSKGTPGMMMKMSKNELYVQTGEGILSILELQPAGKKKVDVVSFINGNGDKWKVGDRFE